VDEGVRHFGVRGVQNPAEGLPGYVHPLGGLLLVQMLDIGQTNRLQLVDRQVHLPQDC